MKLYVGVTDDDWFRFLSARPALDEVNFWQPSGSRRFRALNLGEPFLFKLHAPHHFIVGGGFFASYSALPLQMAWEAFGEKNGARSLAEMRLRIARYRRVAADPRENFTIGCIVLLSPFFFVREEWIPVPADYPRNAQQGVTYDGSSGTGLALWRMVEERLKREAVFRVAEAEGPIWGNPTLIRQRLGQGSFRVLITEIYERRCAITLEKVLPVLQAAHIQPVTEGGRHRVDNGVLLRSDIHTLFDRGYLTITPEYQLRVSHRLKEDFDNGEEYFSMDRRHVWIPTDTQVRPARQFLEWHADTVFLG